MVHFFQHSVFSELVVFFLFVLFFFLLSSLCCLYAFPWSRMRFESFMIWDQIVFLLNEMPFHVFCPLYFFITIIIFILNLILVYLKVYWLESRKSGSWLTSDNYLPSFLEQVIFSLWISVFVRKVEKIILILPISPSWGDNWIRLGMSKAS